MSLPPCDHDECPPTRCVRAAQSKRLLQDNPATEVAAPAACSPDWVETIKEAANHLEKGMSLLRTGPLHYYLRKMTDSVEYLLNRCSPFKVGDLVELAETPVIDGDVAPGWMSSRHFLVEGAKATVRSVDCDGDGLYFGVCFEEETCIYNGQKRPVTSRHIYTFRERFLRKNSVLNEPGLD